MGLIYKYTNVITIEAYIGKTINTVSERFTGHISAVDNGSEAHFHRAIRKYGIENFTSEILEDDINEENINEREIYWIQFYDTYLGKGYNMTKGGDGGFDYINKNGLKYEFTDIDILKAIEANKNMVVVKDIDGNTSKVSVDDERYLNGDLIHNTKGMVVVKDEDGNTKQISKFEFEKGKYDGVVKNTVAVEIKETGQKLRIDTKEYYKNKNLYISSGTLKGSKNGRALRIDIFDENDNLILTTHGDFELRCKELKIPSYLLKNSYQNNGKKIDSKNARKEENRKINGWYAIKDDKIYVELS